MALPESSKYSPSAKHSAMINRKTLNQQDMLVMENALLSIKNFVTTGTNSVNDSSNGRKVLLLCSHEDTERRFAVVQFAAHHHLQRF